MTDIGLLIIAGVVSYLIGAFPTGVIASKLAHTPDVRYSGSTHTGGTNTMRHAGAKIGAAVVVVDALKGILALFLSIWLTQGNPLSVSVAASMAVIGHCFPVYTKFHGGMGLATAGGIILLLSPWTLAIVIPIWAIFYFGVFKKLYSPRSVALSMPIAIAISVAFLPLDAPIKWMLVSMTTILVLRHLPEWNRQE